MSPARAPDHRGRSKECGPRRRGSRKARSESRHRSPRPVSPAPRTRCRSSSPKLADNNHHQSPNPPEVRSTTGHSESPEPEPASPLHQKQRAVPSATPPNQLGTTQASCICSTLTPPPLLCQDDFHLSNLQEITHTAPEPLQVIGGCENRRFILGRVYSRRPRRDSEPPAPHAVQQPADGAARRFKPGLTFARRRARGPGHTGTRRGCASSMPVATTSTQTPATTATVAEQEGRTEAEPPVSVFIDDISRALPPPLLQLPRCRNEQRRKKCPAAPMRKSVRIAARSWSKGDTQTRARQVLMKRLGIMEEDRLTPDDHFLRYIDLFKGPLNGPAVMALTALCGLHDASPMAATQD